MSSSVTPGVRLTPVLAAGFARVALGHVGREYPHKLDHVLDNDADAVTPRALHPIFHGSFDWHSCVHGHWTLAVLLRLFPDSAVAPAIAARFDAALTDDAVAGELAYLGRSSARGFERPYGWAWLLALATELDRARARRWGATLRPLAAAFADRFKLFLPLADHPVRTGMHGNSAFALRLAFDHAEAIGDEALARAVRGKTLDWYERDRDMSAFEPGGGDFLSPTLAVAQLMRRVLAPVRGESDGGFRPWLARFLPGLADGEPQALFRPVRVTDRSDGQIAHGDGLNLSRAWAWRELAPHLDAHAAARVRDAAAAHLAASLPHVAGDYMGEHWLATYAVLALTAEC